MKLSCSRAEFLDALQTAASVVPSRTPKPVLQRVKLEVSQGEGALLATDLEVGLRITLSDVDVNLPGEAMLPPGQLIRILREANDERVMLESAGEGTLVRLLNGEFRLRGEDPEEFPPVEGFSHQQYGKLPTESFRELVRRTVFATEPESVRYALAGVCWELEGQELVAVATDGRRLAKVAVSVEFSDPPPKWPESVVIPTQALQLVERAAKDEYVQFAADAREIQFLSGPLSLRARLHEGQFPAWREVIPRRGEGFKTELVAGPLGAAVRQAEALLGREDRGIFWRFGRGELLVSAERVEYGQGTVRLPVAWEHPDLAVRLDPRFLLEFLRVLPPEASISVQLQSADAPVLFETEDGFCYVVMPMAQ